MDEYAMQLAVRCELSDCSLPPSFFYMCDLEPYQVSICLGSECIRLG